jgi:hypothetical protein
MTGKINDVVRKELMINATARLSGIHRTNGSVVAQVASHRQIRDERSRPRNKARRKVVRSRSRRHGVQLGKGSGLESSAQACSGLADHCGVAVRPELSYGGRSEFQREGAKDTSFTLKHRNIEKFGIQAQEIWSAFDSEGGWTGMLKSFATIAETEATAGVAVLRRRSHPRGGWRGSERSARADPFRFWLPIREPVDATGRAGASRGLRKLSLTDFALPDCLGVVRFFRRAVPTDR